MSGLPGDSYPTVPVALPQSTAKTTDGSTWITLCTIPLAPNQGAYISVGVIGARIDDGSGDLALISGGAAYRRIGTAAPTANAAIGTLLGSPSPAASDASLATVAMRFQVSGNSVLIQVKGVGGATVRFTDVPPSWTLFQLA